MFASRIFSISFSNSKKSKIVRTLAEKPLDVTDEVLLDVVWIALELLKVQRRVIVEALPPASENRYLRSLIELMILFATPYSIASDADIQ
jgi:hypothetical protein